MSYHGKIQTLLKGNADAEIQKWAAEQLEKETNAEPVAWLHIQGNYSEARDRPLDDWEIENGWEEKPLYTTPQTKPLSDEEIEQIAENLKPSSKSYNINFARAIEERHGIK